MSSVQSVPQVSPSTDVDSFFEQWIIKSFERNPELAKKINHIYQINISRKGVIFSSWGKSSDFYLINFFQNRVNIYVVILSLKTKFKSRNLIFTICYIVKIFSKYNHQ
jgi:hypothetical protein